MHKEEFFPLRPEANPTIYAYELPDVATHKGLLKIGYTVRDAQERIAEQLKTARLRHKIVLSESAMRNDGSAFTDHDVHRYLRKKGIANPEGEWFACTIEAVRAALIAIKTGIINEDNRTLDFGMRPEQAEAVDKTIAYFESCKTENHKRLLTNTDRKSVV